ncbi:MAG: acyltransferase family protein [Deltaproteobacteria bacterium]|nr:acyltransferase family protein [Deltaproteobacteria bacterium]
MGREANDGFDAETAGRWLDLVRAVLWRYFRPRVIGAEHLPKGRALIVGCHSGVIPYDAACTLVAVRDASGRSARAVGDHLFGRLAAVETFLRRNGAIIGKPETLAAALRAGNLVLLFPGGARDMERPYATQRYRVLPHRGFAAGRGGYIKVALRTRSPIVPLAVVGTEEAHVMLANLPRLARALTLPLFPWVLFALPLPTQLYIRFGEPIRLPGTAALADDQAYVDGLNEMVRSRVQQLIDDTVRRRHSIFYDSYDDSPPAMTHRRGSRRIKQRSRNAE